MFGFGRFLAVGVVLGMAVATWVCISKYRNREIDAVKYLNDSLVVSKLTGNDVISWFETKDPGNEYISVVLLVSEEALNKLKLPDASLKNIESMLLKHKNVILQAILDKKNNKVVSSRSIIFGELEEGLANLLNSNNGYVVID